MPCVNDMPTDIKKYLKSAGITQKQFAEKMNLSRPTLDTYIEMYEHGQTLPKKSMMIILINCSNQQIIHYKCLSVNFKR